jgi:hypothetical protein
MAEKACRATAAAAPLPLLGAQRASGAGRLAHEPCGRQKAMHAARRAGPGIRTVLISDVAITSETFIEDAYRRAISATVSELAGQE